MPSCRRGGLFPRKGFPESYDRALVADVLGRLALGRGDVEVPHYSHRVYDIAGGPVALGRPDVVIVEGVNALDPVVADFASLGVYLDAAEDDLHRVVRGALRGAGRRRGG